MINTPIYEVNLYLDGNLIGDCRRIAENLSYTRKRTKVGVDSIDFVVNDALLNRWCIERNTTINDILKPLALECRLKRNGIEVVGGFLATMPAYAPLNKSADLTLHFDGFLNLLGGVYIRDTSTNLPLGTITGPAGNLVSSMISLADNIAYDAGKAFNFTPGTIDNLSSITHTFDNYKTVKDWICDRCDNTTGAGPFDVYFHADKTYDILSDSNFGDVISDWVAFYPTLLNNTSATSISAAEIGGFASAVIGIGSGEISASPDENTALFEFVSNNIKVAEYGYAESLYQESSISNSSVLQKNITAELDNASNPIWQPQITLHGRQVEPKPTGSNKIWIGDTITINNSLDLTGMTNGKFRVNELNIVVSDTGDELINPVLERVNE
jgi:hypothetical protein